MTGNPKGSSKKKELIPSDDFKIIRGIGPGIEERLHKNGVLTYDRLAALSPADIAALLASFAGVSTERIIKQNWIGQAHALAQGLEPIESIEFAQVAEPERVEAKFVEKKFEPREENTAIIETQEELIQPERAIAIEPSIVHMEKEIETKPIETLPEPDGPYQASFIVGVKLDAENKVIQTAVNYLQGKQEESWMDWDTERFLNFLTRTAEIKLSDASLIEVASPPMPAEPAPALEPVSTLQIQELEVKPETSDLPSHFIQTGEPYNLGLTLDLSKIKLPPETPVNYILNVQGKSMGGNSRFTISQTEGLFNFTEHVQLAAKGSKLPPGFYRLEASVKLEPLPVENKIAFPLVADARGGLLHVY
jgi:hypothetical protein